MKKFLRKAKKSFLHYWIVLVILPAFWASITSQETKGKLVNTITGVLISILLAIFGIVSLGSVGILKGVGINLTSGLQVLCAYVVLRFIANLIYIPYKIYREKELVASKGTWEDIEVTEHNLQDGDLRSAGLEIIRHAQFDVILAAPVLEEAFVERKHIPQIGSNKFDLWWHHPSGQRSSSSSTRLRDELCIAIADRDNGKPFLHVVGNPNQIELEPEKAYHLRIRLRGEIDGCYLPLRDITVNVQYKNGKLRVRKVNDEILKFIPKDRIE